MKKQFVVSALVAAMVVMLGMRAAADEVKGFTLQDQDGEEVSLSDFEGKVVVLEWTSWSCPFPIRHYNAKNMQALAEKWMEQDVVWLAINSTHYETQEQDKQNREKFGLPYPVLNDSSGEVGKLYGATNTPHMFVLDKDHTIVYQGAIDDDPRGAKLQEGTALNYVDQALTELFADEEISVPKTPAYGCTVKYP